MCMHCCGRRLFQDHNQDQKAALKQGSCFDLNFVWILHWKRVCFDVVFRVRFWTLFLDTVQCPPTVGGHCFRTIIKTRRWTHSGGQCLQGKMSREHSASHTNVGCFLVGGKAVRSFLQFEM
jgi:hypothetical protein